jgi:hypothetical protein
MDKKKEDEIRLMAYQLWLEDGCHGEHALEHWLKAEKEWRDKRNLKITILVSRIIFGLAIIPSIYFLITNNANGVISVMAIVIVLVGLIVGTRQIKYRTLMYSFSFGGFLLGISIIPNISTTDLWNYRLLGLAIIALGFAFHTFTSGERIETQLNNLNKKIIK